MLVTLHLTSGELIQTYVPSRVLGEFITTLTIPRTKVDYIPWDQRYTVLSLSTDDIISVHITLRNTQENHAVKH